MRQKLPTVTRTYRSWCLDSTRWQKFTPRNTDIVVTTPYKCGTTWMIHIVGHLVFGDLKQRPHSEFGRWLEANFAPVEGDIDALEAMACRRVLKTHLPLSALPYNPALRYVYVGRDLRDIFMSLWNHHTNYTPEMWALMTERAGGLGLAMPPPPPAEIREFWRNWITRGWFEWEHDGYPYWSTLQHLSTWWEWRHLPNILFVHYNDLLSDLPRQIARVARFLDIEVSGSRCADIAEKSTFAAMKRDAELVSPGAHFAFRGGPTTFINEGTNGRWRNVLTAEDLALYRKAMRHLPRDAARWLETGAVVQRQPELSI